MKTTILIALLLICKFSFEQSKDQRFVLVKPDMNKIEWLQSHKYYSSLYAYLVCHYDTIGPQKILGEKCDFSQQFKNRISYSQKECPVGVSSYQLTIPFTEVSEIKKLFALLFKSEDFVWSADSLSYTSQSGAGGTFEYKKVKNKIVSNILFTD